VLRHLVRFCERQTWDYESADGNEDEDEDENEDSDDFYKWEEDEEENWFRGAGDDDYWEGWVEGDKEEEVDYHHYIQTIKGTAYVVA